MSVRKQGGLDVHPGEVAVVVLILAAWVCAVALFLNKWSKLRITPSVRPYEGQSKPMNIETIKVVKKNTDSVIYRNYTKEISQTMLAREKRIQRMKTMPNIKVGKEQLEEQFTQKDKALERMKTFPLLPGMAQKPKGDLNLGKVKDRSRGDTPERTAPLLAEVAEEPDAEASASLVGTLPATTSQSPMFGSGARRKKPAPSKKDRPFRRMRTSPVLLGTIEEPKEGEMTSML